MNINMGSPIRIEILKSKVVSRRKRMKLSLNGNLQQKSQNSDQINYVTVLKLSSHTNYKISLLLFRGTF